MTAPVLLALLVACGPQPSTVQAPGPAAPPPPSTTPAAPQGKSTIQDVHFTPDDLTETARWALEKYQAVLDACYQAQLSRTPSASGRARITLEVDRGVLRSFEVVDEVTSSGELGRCMDAKVARWRLPSALTGHAEFVVQMSVP